MTEAEWNACSDPKQMLEIMQDEHLVRKSWLCAVAFCRRLRQHITEPRCLRAYEAAEDFVEKGAQYYFHWTPDCSVAEPERSSERNDLWNAHREAMAAERYKEASVAQAVRSLPFDYSHGKPNKLAWMAAAMAADAMATVTLGFGCSQSAHSAARAEEKRHQAKIVRCVFGNPFHPTSVSRDTLPTGVVDLAQVIYDERAFDRMPILADAFEEAGCTNQDVIEHCRGPGPHVRGCWVVDLLLGKE